LLNADVTQRQNKIRKNRCFSVSNNRHRASGGIIVSPMGLQLGAEKVASSEGILEVLLDADSTPHEFAMRFLNKLMVGMYEAMSFGDTVTATVHRVCERCGNRFEVKENEKVCPQCVSINNT